MPMKSSRLQQINNWPTLYTVKGIANNKVIEFNFAAAFTKKKVAICNCELELYIRKCKHFTFRIWVDFLKFNIATVEGKPLNWCE